MAFTGEYNFIISVENILLVWEKFLKGKRNKKDVADFQTNLSDNIVNLHRDLKSKTYTHGLYSAFNISDPKPRNIHKATVRDRVLHHLIYHSLNRYFDDLFIYDSYSCRAGKGTHRAIKRFRNFAQKVSKNHICSCFVLKCDIRKFFANIDHKVLMKILERHIVDPDINWLINQVVSSFYTNTPNTHISYGLNEKKGLPLGNLTSQLLVNVYMHEFDMYIKQELRVKYYIRYADDFVILSEDRKYLENILQKFEKFLNEKLQLTLHENKVYIKTYSSGVDFLGWVNFPYHKQIRTTTKRKVIKNMKGYPKSETVNSYRGLLGHGNTHNLQKFLRLTPEHEV
ncbi:MAG: reverse transcriptase/maturase family protein [bacterium]